jgi:uncharacterized protein YgiM (DUF1202 family)
MKRRHLIAAIVMALALVLLAAVAMAETYYVKTGDGKTVNVRYTDDTSHEVLAQLKYGTKVNVLAFTKGGAWALITYDGKTKDGDYYYGDAYIMSKFLVPYKPEPYSGGGSGSGSGTDTSSLNALFSKAKIVDPYRITVRPTRASGQVNVRWAPSKASTLLRAFPSGAELNVIAELGTDWFQVEDPDSGVVGFLNKAYIVK